MSNTSLLVIVLGCMAISMLSISIMMTLTLRSLERALSLSIVSFVDRLNEQASLIIKMYFEEKRKFLEDVSSPERPYSN